MIAHDCPLVCDDSPFFPPGNHGMILSRGLLNRLSADFWRLCETCKANNCHDGFGPDVHAADCAPPAAALPACFARVQMQGGGAPSCCSRCKRSCRCHSRHCSCFAVRLRFLSLPPVGA